MQRRVPGRRLLFQTRQRKAGPHPGWGSPSTRYPTALSWVKTGIRPSNQKSSIKSKRWHLCHVRLSKGKQQVLLPLPTSSQFPNKGTSGLQGGKGLFQLETTLGKLRLQIRGVFLSCEGNGSLQPTRERVSFAIAPSLQATMGDPSQSRRKTDALLAKITAPNSPGSGAKRIAGERRRPTPTPAGHLPTLGKQQSPVGNPTSILPAPFERAQSPTDPGWLPPPPSSGKDNLG